MKCKCGSELEGRARLCEACKAESQRLREERRRKQRIKRPRLCRKCGAAPVVGPYASYCRECGRVVRGAGAQKRAEANRARRKAGPKPFALHSAVLPPVRPGERPLWKEPKGSKDSLDHVVWELEVLNRERRAKGLGTLTYGQYSLMRREVNSKNQ